MVFPVRTLCIVVLDLLVVLDLRLTVQCLLACANEASYCDSLWFVLPLLLIVDLQLLCSEFPRGRGDIVAAMV